MTNEITPGTVGQLVATLETVLRAHGFSDTTIASIKSSPALQYWLAQSQPAAKAGDARSISVAEEWAVYMDEAVSKAPEPLRQLGEYLAGLLDEDQWKTAERYLNAAALSSPASQSVEKEAAEYWREKALLSSDIALPHKEEATPAPVGEQGPVAGEYETLIMAGFDDYTARCALRTEADGGFCHAYFYSDGQWRFQTGGNDLTDGASATIRCVLTKRLYATPATTTTERGRG